MFGIGTALGRTYVLQYIRRNSNGLSQNLDSSRQCDHYWRQFLSSSSLVFSPKAGYGRNQSPVRRPVWLWAHCNLGSFLGVGCHCFPPPLDVPTFASRCLHVQVIWETSIRERRNYGREMAGQFCLWFRLPRKPRVLWHAAQICDMGDIFKDLSVSTVWKRTGGLEVWLHAFLSSSVGD